MRTIIHDLNELEIKEMKFEENDILVSSLLCTRNCIGCFSCWTKHPKKCAIKDGFSNIVEFIKDSDELVIISKNRYGCYSASTKRVLERCIGYVLPFFTIRNGEIHHESRYEKQVKLSAYFYGDISAGDRKNLDLLIRANAINLNANSYELKCVSDLKELETCIH